MNDRVESKLSNKLMLLSAGGSVSSLTALVIVLIEMIKPEHSVSPQMKLWQFSLAFIALLATGTAVVVTYDYLKEIHADITLPLRVKAFKSLLVLSVGIIGFAIFVDGFMAAIYWKWWSIVSFLVG